MRLLVLLPLMCALTGSACQTQVRGEDCLPLTPDGSQGAALLPGGLMNVRYGGTSREPLRLDVYPHADGPGKPGPSDELGVVPGLARPARPLALVLRGGAGTVGQRSSYVGQLIETFGDAGYVVATADYRFGVVSTAADDVQRALAMLTMCHATALHVDARRTVLVAEDSAAPVALHLADTLHRLRLGRFGGAPQAPAAVVIAGGRFDNVVPPVVPTYIVHGGSDSDVPLARARAACTGATAACDVVEVAGASHRVENWWPSQWGYKAAMLRALDARIGAVPEAAHPSPAGGLHKRVVFDAVNGLTLDAWVPAGETPHAAVVIVHGGGWEAGDRVTYATPMVQLASSLDIAWVSIDYRLTPRVTNREQMTDVATALAWLREHGRPLRIDPSKLILVGESASGQIVTHLAATERSLAGVVSFYGVYDIEAMAGDPANPRSLARRLFGLTSLDDPARETLRAFSPVRHAAKEMPPLLLVAGTSDRLIDQQRAYVATVRSAGARVTAVEIDGAPHGMEAWHDQPRWRIWEREVAAWLRGVIGVNAE